MQWIGGNGREWPISMPADARTVAALVHLTSYTLSSCHFRVWGRPHADHLAAVKRGEAKLVLEDPTNPNDENRMCCLFDTYPSFGKPDSTKYKVLLPVDHGWGAVDRLWAACGGTHALCPRSSSSSRGQSTRHNSGSNSATGTTRHNYSTTMQALQTTTIKIATLPTPYMYSLSTLSGTNARRRHNRTVRGRGTGIYGRWHGKGDQSDTRADREWRAGSGRRLVWSDWKLWWVAQVGNRECVRCAHSMDACTILVI